MILLHRPSIPENERKRILQILTEYTKPDAHQVCLVKGPHKGAIVKGHLTPESWLRRIASDNHVYAFAKLPISAPYGNPNDGFDLPQLMGVRVAFTARFTCREHEKLFNPIDSVSANLRDQRNLNLMAYKAILAGLWQKQLLHQAWTAVLSEVPEDEAFRLDLRNSRQQMIGLEHYCREMEQCLNPQNCGRCKGQDCKVVGHEVRHISGSPSVAVSQFSDGTRMRVDRVRRTRQPVANWGITVMPAERGHSVILHYFRQEYDIMCDNIESIRSLSGHRLQEYLSPLILDHCENIAIGRKTWNAFGAKKRKAITERYVSEAPETPYGPPERVAEMEYRRLNPDQPIPNPKQINLFNVRI